MSTYDHAPRRTSPHLLIGLLVLIFAFSGWCQDPSLVPPEVRLKSYTQTYSYNSGYDYDVDWYGFAYSGSGNWGGWHNINWNTATGGFERSGNNYSGIWTYPDWGTYNWAGFYESITTWPAPPGLGTTLYTNSWHSSYPDGSGGTSEYGDTNSATYGDISQPGGFPWRYAQTYRYDPYEYEDSDPDGAWWWTYNSTWTVSDSARTRVDLHTGGPTNSTELTVFSLTVSAYNMETWEVIDPTLIQIRTNNADTNGVIILSLNDNSVYDVTPTLPAAYSNYYFNIYPEILQLEVRLTVNGDHDGTNMFWVNNDVDILHQVDLWTAWEYDDDKDGPSDYTHNFVRTLRDLEDFFPLLLTLPPHVTNSTGWTCTLKSPCLLKVFYNPSPTGIDYLTVTNVAEQIVANHSLFLGDGVSITLPMAMFITNGLSANVLAEAGSLGDGYLTMELRQDGVLMARDRVRLRILDIKDFYERWTVGNSQSPGVNTSLTPSPIAFSVGGVKPVQPWEDDNYILLVHGWNMPVWEKERYAETAFKRLWHLGFRGRLGQFQWPTFYFGNFWDPIDLRNFDTSEHNAWRSAEGLCDLLRRLNERHPGKVRMMAHSMGNVVAGEALRLSGTNQLVHTYVAAQAAIPANAYDDLLARPNVPYSPTVEDVYGSYPYFNSPDGTTYCYFESSRYAGAASFKNYYNPLDWALIGKTVAQPTWLLNQSTKPDNWTLGYNYVTPNALHPSGFYRNWGAGYYDFTNLFFPNDRYRIFAFCGQSWTYALGAQADVNGKFSGNQVDLNAEFQFGREHKGHSAQFRSAYLYQHLFWRKLLEDMQF